MPEMFEIYQKYAPRYHELVTAEDHENNLGSLLHQLAEWKEKSVLEAGVGTGRVTQLYIAEAAEAFCCDRSAHMLDFAQRSLAGYSHKIRFMWAENENLPDLGSRFELFIEGWSFGHSIMACDSQKEILQMTDILHRNAARNLAPGGTILIIETLGTNTQKPFPPDEKLKIFYETLVEKYAYERHEISTDYMFPDNGKAAEVMGFFFGEEMEQAVIARGTSIIPEWTGVWIKKT